MGHPLPLFSRRDRRSARALVEGCGLRFEEDFDDLVGVFAAGRLAGCGARRGRVLKMLAVAEEHRGGGLLGDIVTELMRRGREAGGDGFFIFTRPATAGAFQSLGFKPLAEHERAVLLEQGNGVQGWRRRQAALARGGDNAALIADAPFSPQQQRFIAAAAALADTLYVLVPGDAGPAAAFPGNVVVAGVGPYWLDAAVFPGYFLKPDDDLERIRLEINAELIGRHIAPLLHIRVLMAAAPPPDSPAARHQEILARRLERWGVRLMAINPE